MKLLVFSNMFDIYRAVRGGGTLLVNGDGR